MRSSSSTYPYDEEVPLKPPRRKHHYHNQQQQQQREQLKLITAVGGETETEEENEHLLPPQTTPQSAAAADTAAVAAAADMYSNLRYARTNLSHSSLLLNQQQNSFDGSSAPASIAERTESSETLDVPLNITRRGHQHHNNTPTTAATRLLSRSSGGGGGSTTFHQLQQQQQPSALASALHATAKLAASVDAYAAAATAQAAVADYSLCDSCRPLRYSHQHYHGHSHSNLSRPVHTGHIGSSRYLGHNFNSNSPQAGSRRFNGQPVQIPLPQPTAVVATPPQPPVLSIAQQSVSSSGGGYPPYHLRHQQYHQQQQQNQVSRFQPRHHRTGSSSMSQSGEDLHSPTYLSWRKLQLSRAKLKASSKTSALLSGFAMVAMVEVQLNNDTKVPNGMLVAFAICTTMLVAVHMLALMISTCILPNIETVCNLHSISLVHESPHERLHWYIETAWAFSTLLGLILFLLEIAILCWVKFYDLSPPAAWSACIVLIPVMIIFLAFAVHFYRSLVTHKYEVTVSGIRELEMLKEQMEQDHLEHHNNTRNNGLHYGASGDIV
ncbi:uncharacterized protein Orai isoform X1 [Drosophila tropicalis]|uniref:uncharacterized protein Orai isoform X1 n=1 Tax=Drosophila tropicalis TaxID=46794 RepID=UPI0035ABBB14